MEQAREALALYIRPRDEVAHIRKVLGAHLDSCLGITDDSSHRKPLALVDPPSPISLTPEIGGLQREYFRALNANVKARHEFDTVRAYEAHPGRSDAASIGSASTSRSGQQTPGILSDHILILRLRRKQQRLQAIAKYLDLLNRMPAASLDFLDPAQVFKGSPPLPEVPKDAVSSFVLDKTLSQTSLDELLDRLQKTVLRARLALRREEQLLAEAKRRQPASASSRLAGDAGAKLAALTATRDELIGWMEAELAKASGGEGSSQNGDDQPNSARQIAERRTQVDEQLSVIKQKYDEYLASRKALVQLVSQKRQLVIRPPPSGSQSSSAQASEALRLGPSSSDLAYTFFPSPSLERLLSVSHEQKTLILQKSHFNITLAKQAKDASQALDHLAEESQLLPRYPIPGARTRQRSQVAGLPLNDDLSGRNNVPASEEPSVSSRARRWVFAAESAKISTLEAVAAKTEEWELALEGSTRHLDELDLLLGRLEPMAVLANGDPEAEASLSDIWLSQDQQVRQEPAIGSTRQPPSRQDKVKRSKARTGGGDIWDILDGDLGLIRDETLACSV